MKMAQTGLHCSGKIRYFLVFTKNLKIHNISVKHTERYSIQVKNLIFFSNFSKISKFPAISSNGIALQ